MTPIVDRGDPRSLSVRFPVEEPESLVTQVDGALGGGSVRTISLDLGALEYIDPRALRALLAVVAAASAAGVEVHCAHARPPVYKALHLAGIAGRVKRVATGIGPE